MTTLEAHAMSDIITKLQITDKLLIWLKYPFPYRNYAPSPQLIFTTPTICIYLNTYFIRSIFLCLLFLEINLSWFYNNQEIDTKLFYVATQKAILFSQRLNREHVTLDWGEIILYGNPWWLINREIYEDCINENTRTFINYFYY